MSVELNLKNNLLNELKADSSCHYQDTIILKLPVEILSKFFESLPLKDLVNATVTCKSWKILSKQLLVKDRKKIYSMGELQGLSWCECAGASKNARAIYENKIAELALRAFPPPATPQFNILSIGSGKLLQELTLISLLASKGFQSIQLDLVDPSIEEAKVRKLQEIFDHYLPASVRISYTKSTQVADVVQGKDYHFCYAIDFEAITYSSDAWHTIFEALEHLDPKGFIYVQKYAEEQIITANEFIQKNESPFRISYLRMGEGHNVSLLITAMTRFFEKLKDGYKKYEFYANEPAKTFSELESFLVNHQKVVQKFNLEFSFHAYSQEIAVDLLHLNVNHDKPLSEKILSYDFDIKRAKHLEITNINDFDFSYIINGRRDPFFYNLANQYQIPVTKLMPRQGSLTYLNKKIAEAGVESSK